MNIEPEIQQNGNNLLRIEASAYTELVHRTFLTMYHKFERLFVTHQLISHIIEGIGPENRSDSILDRTFSEFFLMIEADLFHKITSLTVRNSSNFHIGNPDRLRIDIYGLLVVKFLFVWTYQCLDTVQRFLLVLSRNPPSLHNRCNALVVETHHVELRKIRLYSNIRYADILLIRLSSQHIDTLGNDISKVIQ